MLDLVKRALGISPLITLDDLVREAAEHSIDNIGRRLSGETATMSGAELRGYVRARAQRPVREAAVRVAAQHRMPLSMADAIAARALEWNVHRVVHRIVMQPVVAPAAFQATLRKVA